MSRKKKIISAVVIVFALLIGFRAIGTKPEAAEVKQSYIPVNAQTVEKQDISATIT